MRGPRVVGMDCCVRLYSETVVVGLKFQDSSDQCLSEMRSSPVSSKGSFLNMSRNALVSRLLIGLCSDRLRVMGVQSYASGDRGRELPRTVLA